MSTQRSNSGVRDLRAMFENQDRSASQDNERGRSPTGAVATDSNGTVDQNQSSVGATRKVMASFVPVGPEPTSTTAANGFSSVGSKREEDSSASNHLKNALVTEQAGGSGNVPEVVAAPGSSAAMTLPDDESQAEHTEKPISAVADQTAALEPADVTSKATVSGGAVLASRIATTEPTVSSSGTQGSLPAKASKNVKGMQRLDGAAQGHAVSDVKKSLRTSNAAKQTTTAPKLFSQKPPVSSSATKSTPSQPKAKTAQTGVAHAPTVKATPQKTATTASVTPPKRSPTQPISLPSHLTAATASSAAKHEAPAPTTKMASRPIERSSHLMAPTAASAAKHDPSGDAVKANGPSAANPATKRDRASLASATTGRQPKPATSTRSSLAPANGASGKGTTSRRTSSNSTDNRPSGDFLQRMMRPTTSSTSKLHEKGDAKSPPRSTATAAATTTAKPKPVAASKPTVKAKTVAPVAPRDAKSKPAAQENSRPSTKAGPAEVVQTQPVAPQTPPEADAVIVQKDVDVIAEPQTPHDKVELPHTTASASGDVNSDQDSLHMIGGALMGRMTATPNFASETIH